MSEQPAQKPTSKPRRSPIWATLKRLVRARVTAGVITILPILITFWLVRAIFRMMRDASQWVVLAILDSAQGEAILERILDESAQESLLDPNRDGDGFTSLAEAFDALGVAMLPQSVQWGIPIFSVLLTIFVLYTIGLFTANIIGKRFIYLTERLVERMPLVKTVYGATKQIVRTLGGDQTRKFQRVALIPFPQARMRCVGFITAMFKDSVSGEELCTVFIPTTPNPTTGYLQVLKRSDLIELDWSVEEAVQTIMSGGILRPKFLTIVTPETPEAYTDMQRKVREAPPASPSDAQ